MNFKNKNIHLFNTSKVIYHIEKRIRKGLPGKNIVTSCINYTDALYSAIYNSVIFNFFLFFIYSFTSN